MSIGAIYGGSSSISAWNHYNGLKDSLSGASASGNDSPPPDAAFAQAALSVVPAAVVITPDSIRSTSAGAASSGVSLVASGTLSSAQDPHGSARALASLLAGHAGTPPQAATGAAADPDVGGDTSPDGDGTGLPQYTRAFQAFVQWSDQTIVQTATIVPTPEASIEKIIVKTASPG